MFKFALILIIALCLGIGSGLTRNWWESGQHEEHFRVFQEVIEVDDSLPHLEHEPQQTNFPEVAIEGSTTHNFGSLEKGNQGSHEFIFKNIGTGPLTITLTNTSCKCTLSDLSGKEKTIAPGDSYPVKLTFKSDNWSKKFRQSATIQTNDPARRTIQLFVEGVILQPVRPEPDKIVFSNTTASEEAETSFKLYGYKWDDVVIENLEFLDEKSREFFSADFRPLTDEELKREANALCGYQVDLRTKKGLPLGPLRQTLKITTNHEVLELPITGRVTGEFIINVVGTEFTFEEDKNQLRLGKLAGDRDVSVELVLSTGAKSGDEISISLDESETFPSSDHIQVEILKDKFRQIGRLYQFPIRVTIPKSCPNVSMLGPEESNLGRFVIHTTHPIEKTIEVYVRFAKTR